MTTFERQKEVKSEPKIMPELRKLLRLSKSGYAITIPAKYREALGLKEGDYVVISLWDKNTLRVRRQKAPSK